MKQRRGRSRKPFAVPVLLLAVGFALFVPNPLPPNRLGRYQLAVDTVRYEFSGLNLFSEWAIVNCFTHPISVTANNTGAIPEYTTLAALNRTIIGMHRAGKVWQNLTQTGWYWDSANRLLYIHFQTWRNTRYRTTEITLRAAALGTASTSTSSATTVVTPSPGLPAAALAGASFLGGGSVLFAYLLRKRRKPKQR